MLSSYFLDSIMLYIKQIYLCNSFLTLEVFIIILSNKFNYISGLFKFSILAINNMFTS